MANPATKRKENKSQAKKKGEFAGGYRQKTVSPN